MAGKKPARECAGKAKNRAKTSPRLAQTCAYVVPEAAEGVENGGRESSLKSEISLFFRRICFRADILYGYV